MTTDLWMLAYTSLFSLALTSPAFLGSLRLEGAVPWFLGNREAPLEGPAWLGRARRAHGNLVEALAPFAALVLTAHVSGTANEMTADVTTRKEMRKNHRRYFTMFMMEHHRRWAWPAGWAGARSPGRRGRGTFSGDWKPGGAAGSG